MESSRRMEEEVKMSEYVITGNREGNDGCDEDRVLEWEIGLPSGGDLAPLSQLLISPELASAFSISPEPAHTIGDVNLASERTLSMLRSGSHASSSNNLQAEVAPEAVDEDRFGSSSGGSDSKKKKKSDGGSAAVAMVEEADSGTEDPSGKTTKRPRLVWTPELHKRFVEVVAHLGLQNAVPKTIMQLMNVEGLTRENVASHLQKYRLYIKRKQGDLPPEAPSSSDQIFSSAPVPPQSFNNGSGGVVQPSGGHLGMPIPVPYGAAPTPNPGIHVPVYGNIGMQGYHHHHQHSHTHNHYHQNHLRGGSGLESHQYTMQPREWPGKNYGSVPPYPSVGGGGANKK